jgi:hypothetical protein
LRRSPAQLRSPFSKFAIHLRFGDIKYFENTEESESVIADSFGMCNFIKKSAKERGFQNFQSANESQIWREGEESEKTPR